jgi:hypothetical protein
MEGTGGQILHLGGFSDDGERLFSEKRRRLIYNSRLDG